MPGNEPAEASNPNRVMSLKLRIQSLWNEVRRRKVFRAASIYLVAMWTLALGAAELFPAFGVPNWAVRLIVIVGVIGFPLVVAGAWLFEITSQGVVLDAVAKEHRQRGSTTRIVPSSATTTWAQTRHIEASWRDDTGEHAAQFSTGFILGRDTVAEVHIEDPRISRLHARVSYERGQWWIEDLASRNGTNVNGILITEKVPLGELAEIYLYEGGRPIHLRVRRALPFSSEPAASEGSGAGPDGAP